MKIIQVIPREDAKRSLKALLKAKERELRDRPTAFRRQREGRWVHAKYPGWINWTETMGGVLIAEIHTRVADSEWQLLQSFIGYLDRHLRGSIDMISITYR